MRESTSFYNPALSANRHVIQICRFSLSAAADLPDGSRERRTSPFNGDAQSWNGIERSLSRAVVQQSLTVSAITFPTLYIDRAGGLQKSIQLSKLFSMAELLPFEQENTSIWSVLLAWSGIPTKCYWVIHGRLTSECKASTSPTSFINLSIPPLKRQGPCLYVHACMNQSSIHTLCFLAPTSTLEHSSIDSLNHWVRLRMRRGNYYVW